MLNATKEHSRWHHYMHIHITKQGQRCRKLMFNIRLIAESNTHGDSCCNLLITVKIYSLIFIQTLITPVKYFTVRFSSFEQLLKLFSQQRKRNKANRQMSQMFYLIFSRRNYGKQRPLHTICNQTSTPDSG